MLQVWVEEEQQNWVPNCLLSETDDEEFEKISEASEVNGGIKDQEVRHNEEAQNVDSQGQSQSPVPKHGDSEMGRPKNISLETPLISENTNGVKVNQDGNNKGRNYFAFSFVNKDREGKLKKFKRLKTRQRKQSKSPQAHSRKAKRPRKNDLFDLNSLLGLRDESSSEQRSDPFDPVSVQENFCTPDLNLSRHDTEVIPDKNDDEEVRKIGDSVDSNIEEIQGLRAVQDNINDLIHNHDNVPIVVETNATINLGKQLGAENLDVFQNQVQQLVTKEGFQEIKI
ncbi:hypothetical protein Hanom_Chr12g01116231 [Helianthus anomalus]